MYSIGNEVAKELIHMTHGHEQVKPLALGLSDGMGVAEWWGKRGKHWDNCNGIINKI